MTTAATHQANGNTIEAALFVAFELSERTWKLGFTTGPGQKPRERRSPHGIIHHVVDASAIEVSRRQRWAKSDGLDVRKLLSLLIRYEQGEKKVCQVVEVPSVEAEAHRHLHRGLDTLERERASTTTRIQGLLRSPGIRLTSLNQLPEQLDALRLWDGAPMPPGFRQRMLRVYAHHPFLSEQSAEVEAARRAQLQASSETSIEQRRQ